jgi:hypothetical protein
MNHNGALSYHSLLASNWASLLFCMAASVSYHYINVIGNDQELMCSVQLTSFLFLLDPPLITY